MSYNPFMLALLIEVDPIALWGLIVGIVSAVIALVAAVAGILAAKYAKAAPTTEDLARVEGNTAHLEEVRASIASVDSRLRKQEDAERLKRRANRVSIDARGYQSGTAPLDLQLFVKPPQESDFSVTDLELCNEHGNLFGSFPCSRMGNPDGLNFCAAIPMENMGEWFRGGTPDPRLNGRRLKLRVWMSMGGGEVFRDMGVIVMQPEPGSRYPVFDVKGRV